MRVRISAFWPAVIALIVATVLFCLPGEELPRQDWFALVQLDKWAHVVLFAGLVSLWGLPLILRIDSDANRKTAYIWVVSGFVLYGLAIELIQGAYIPHRDFDLFDLAADTIGCGVGWWFLRWQNRLQYNH